MEGAIEENTDRINIMEDHLKNVQQELVYTQSRVRIPPPVLRCCFSKPRRTGSLCTHPAVHVEQEATPPSHGCTVLAALGPSHQTAVSAQTADLLTSLAG